MWQYHRSNWSAGDSDPTQYVWFNFPHDVSDRNALLLRGYDRIRFIPRPGYFWSASSGPLVTAKAWDMSKGFTSSSSSDDELSLLNVNTNPDVDTLQSLTNPIGLFSIATVTVVATRYGCDGVPNSGMVHDACCVCGGNGSQCPGCDGRLGSGTTIDSCGVCNGNDTSCLRCDYVPFSGADGSTGCGCVSNGEMGVVYSFLDCRGDCYGTAQVDRCGVCSGDSTGHAYNKDM